MNRHPLRSGHDSRLFTSQMNAGLFSKSESIAGFIDRIDSSGIPVLIEKGVARNLDRVRQSKRAMRASFLRNPASKIMLAVGDTAAAVESRVRHIPSQSGEGSHNLKG